MLKLLTFHITHPRCSHTDCSARRVCTGLMQINWPKAGNFLFWIVGCMGHSADGFVLTPEGYDALVGQLPSPL